MNHPTCDEIFREMAITDTPFEKWQYFEWLGDSATIIYLPYQKQSHLCNLQFKIFETLRKTNSPDYDSAYKMMEWLTSHKKHTTELFGTASPRDYYDTFCQLTPTQVTKCINDNSQLFLLFNPSHLNFDGVKKVSTFNKLAFWR